MSLDCEKLGKREHEGERRKQKIKQADGNHKAILYARKQEAAGCGSWFGLCLKGKGTGVEGKRQLTILNIYQTVYFKYEYAILSYPLY